MNPLLPPGLRYRTATDIRFPTGLLVLLTVWFMVACPDCAHAGGTPIVMDGEFGDWAGVPLLHADPSGDVGSSDVDFGQVWATNDDTRLYLRFEIGLEKEAQEANSMALYIDGDGTTSTGLAVAGLGAEYKWSFGTRTGTAYSTTGSVAGTQNWAASGIITIPTTAADEFELCLERGAVASGVAVFTSSTVLLRLRNEDGGVQDTVPDAASAPMSYSFDSGSTPPYTPIPLARRDARHVRIYNHNVLFDNFFAQTAAHTRLIQATQPDLLCFQEIYSHTLEDTTGAVTTMLGGTWHGAKTGAADTVIVSRWPVLASHAIDGNLGAHIDLPDTTYTTNLYVINMHTPCCSNEAGRQAEIDHIMQWVGDLTTTGGSYTLPDDTPIIVIGDANLVGLRQQVVTLLTGDIVDNGTYGPDVLPDWDGSALAREIPIHVGSRDSFTWYSPASSFAPGQLDVLAYTDSVLVVARSYLLWTPGMSAVDLSANGLLSTDAPTASDHIPVIADLAPAGIPVPVGMSLWGVD